LLRGIDADDAATKKGAFGKVVAAVEKEEWKNVGAVGHGS